MRGAVEHSVYSWRKSEYLSAVGYPDFLNNVRHNLDALLPSESTESSEVGLALLLLTLMTA